MKILGLIAGAAMLLGAQSAYAVTISNGGFDSPAAGNPFDTLGTGNNASLPGWTVGGNGVDHIGNFWNAQAGGSSLDMSGSNGDGHGSIYQALSLEVGKTYTVNFYMSGNTGSNGDHPGSEVKSLFGGIYASNSNFDPLNSIAGIGNDYDTSLLNPTTGAGGNMNWVPLSFSFNVATAGTYYLAFLDTTSVASMSGAVLDSVSIAATPIPGALLLFGSALGGMGFLGYRRKKQAVEA